MIYLELFLAFLEVGLFSFGGAYAAIPLIRDVVLEHAWMSDEQIAYIIAVSESTPGPFAINIATFVGNTTADRVYRMRCSYLPLFGNCCADLL